MPLGYFLLAHWRLIVAVLVCVLLLLPFFLLHVFVLTARWSEPKLKGAEQRNIMWAGHAPIHVYVKGNAAAKRTWVFIHGSPATASAFHKQFMDEASEDRLVAYDRPGFGGSGSDPRSFSLEEQVAALGVVLKTLELTNCVLVGHSYGAPVALQGALENPERARGILLVGGSIDPELEHTMLIQKVAAFPLADRLLPAALRNCNREILALKPGLETLRGKIPRLAVPVIMLHGGMDRLVPVANVAYLEKELTLAKKPQLFMAMVHTNDNHFIPWEQPQKLHEAMRAMIGLLEN